MSDADDRTDQRPAPDFTGPNTGPSAKSSAISTWAGKPSRSIWTRRRKVQPQRARSSKLDPFKGHIAEWLEKDPRVTAAVIEQRLRPARLYRRTQHSAGVCAESSPTTHGQARLRAHGAARRRTLRSRLGTLRLARIIPVTNANCMPSRWSMRTAACSTSSSRTVKASRLSHVATFTLSLRWAVSPEKSSMTTLPPQSPNMTAAWFVFYRAFSASPREYSFYPRACNPASGWEKGKVERAIGYLRQNFWPLREFTDLHDVNRQARQWLAEVANQREHRETRQRPMDRFQPAALRPLPVIPYDYRDSVEALVHKDLRVQFDANRYCVPHRYVGRRLTVKADCSSVAILQSRRRSRQLCALLSARSDVWGRPFRACASGTAAGGATFASAATAARFARWSLFPRSGGSLPP